ncbi:MAG: L28 family ribosomal protein [Patescibacteria group bacterium]
MAKTCDLCGRGTTRDASRSHSNIRTLKRQYINLQARKIDGKNLKVCTSCLKTRKKVKKTAK